MAFRIVIGGFMYGVCRQDREHALQAASDAASRHQLHTTVEILTKREWEELPTWKAWCSVSPAGQVSL